MAKTFTAPFAQTNKTAAVTVTDTAEARLATAGVDGALVTKLSALPAGTVTASKLKLLLSKDSGVTKTVIDSVLLAAYTDEDTKATPLTSFTRIGEQTPLRLESGDQLYVSSGVSQAAGVVFVAEWSDF
ncbi:MAG: hypothetical protein CMH98_01155 [Oceanospirillaceae bacterium]|nr:hypothetical protein [Oceanospirillaceae bacterium]